MIDPLTERETEFFHFVWDHSADPFQRQFDALPSLSQPALDALVTIVRLLAQDASLQRIARAIREAVDGGVPFAIFLQVVGLTRNKILTDLRASASIRSASDIKIPSNYEKLPYSTAWKFAGPYLAERLRDVLHPLARSGCPSTALPDAIRSILLATLPGFVRQERAKRQGHEAERRIAAALANCRLPFEPEDKLTEPLTRDASVCGISFDIVIPSTDSPKICVKSTVHTANIGQYGESKDRLEVLEAREALHASYPTAPPPFLFAFVDGIGFQSNKEGLRGVLSGADEFLQFRTLWKIVMAASTLLDVAGVFLLPPDHLKYCKSFINRWGSKHNIKSLPDSEAISDLAPEQPVPCGDAFVLLRR